MSKKLALTDFRAVRVVLEPEDFALGGDEPDPPPSDLIAAETWSGITVLPDDVAIRTSDHNGLALGEVYCCGVSGSRRSAKPRMLFPSRCSTPTTIFRRACLTLCMGTTERRFHRSEMFLK